MNMKDRLEQAYKNKQKDGDNEDSPALRVPTAPDAAASAKTRSGAKPLRAAPIPTKTAPADLGGLLKKTSADRGYRKVAKFLLLLGQEEAANVMRHLPAADLEKIVAEISTIGAIESVEAEAILNEFGELVKRGQFLSGGTDAAKEMLVAAFGEEKGHHLFKKALPEAAGKPFDFLKDSDSNRLLLLLKGEAPAVMAIILPYIEPKTASEVIVKLSEAERTEVVRRMAKLEKIAPEVIANIESGIKNKLLRLGKVDTEAINGVEALAGIMRYLNPEEGEDILDSISEQHPEISDSIRDRLFTLEDLLRLRPLDVQRELRSFQNRDLAIFLKGKGKGLRELVLGNVSKERRFLIEDEESVLGAMRKAEVDEASRRVLARFKDLYESGKISFTDDDDVVQ
jgi:flagellar motor switch protein FliG